MTASNVPASVNVPTCSSEITYSVMRAADPLGVGPREVERSITAESPCTPSGCSARRGIGQQRVADRDSGTERRARARRRTRCVIAARFAAAARGGAAVRTGHHDFDARVLGRPDAELDTARRRAPRRRPRHGSGRRNSAPSGGSWSVSDQYHSRSGTGTASTPPRLPVPEPP